MSDFHPKSWNPSWQVSSILTGVLSFMTSEDMTTGSITATPSQRIEYAAQSKEWNNKSPKFREEFPDLFKSNKEQLDMLARQKLASQPPAGELPAQSTTEKQVANEAHHNNNWYIKGRYILLTLMVALIIASRMT